MAQESVQLSNNFAELPDKGTGEITIDPNGTINSEATQIKSTQGVGSSNNLAQLSNPNQ